MAAVTPPRNGIPIGIVTVNGRQVPVDVHPEYLRFFEGLLIRAGGITGSGTTDLTLSQFEDAGIEETKAGLYRLSDDLWQFPPTAVFPSGAEDATPHQAEIEDLRAQVAELVKAVEALQQGLTA